ncbi:MAG: PBP1A family penicillin-binding protein [Clostridiales bacterium]|nr:PBP1A family penicillin-binding protein [Clostridiales bacterium]
MNQQEPFVTRREKRIDKRNNRKKKAIKIILAIPLISAAIFLTIIAFFLGTAVSTWKGLDINKLENIQQSSFVYDYRDDKITNIHGKENRIKVPLSEIPTHVKNAFIAVEDVRFYAHPGFDIKRLVSSLIHNIKAGAYVQGGGTITQQIVRNGFLTQKKLLSRKIQEIYLAYQLEKEYTKEQILQTYLNLIYFGKGAYGVEAASNKYFGKPVKNISVAEGAMLAGIIKNPGHYSPLIDKKSSMSRKDLVLDLMAKNGFLSPEECAIAKEEIIDLKETQSESNIHSFFMDMVIKEAAEVLRVKEETLFTNGYRIYTTLDKDLQEYSESIFENEDFFPTSPVTGEHCQGALVVLDSATGGIRALIGGRGPAEPIRKAFNRAVHSKRQPGSAIKPLVVYTPALESYGYTPVTFIEDAPFTIGNYSPSNYGGKYRGWVTLREAIAMSINVPAVKVLYDIGINGGIGFAKRLGIPFDEEDRSLSVALGGFHRGISPIELARAYSTLADRGKYKDYTTIRRIEDPKGVTVYNANHQKSQNISVESTFIMNNILKSSIDMEGGTAARLKSLGIPLAAKTGTVQLPNTKEFEGIKGIKDTWLAVYNPDYVLTVWMGFDVTNTENYLPSEAVGGSYPADILKELIEHIYSKKPARDFEKPLNVVEVELDGKALKERHEVLLASPLTPDDQIVLEYFKRDNVPKEETDYWIMPNAPVDFGITLSQKGLPLISFTPAQNFAAYDIYKSANGKNAILAHHINAGKSDRIQWEDPLVKPGESYSYFIVATHPEIIIDGKPIQSIPTPTVTIAIPDRSNTPPIENQEQAGDDSDENDNTEGAEKENNKISIQIP